MKKINTRMWLEALRIIPRISKEEWDSLDLVSRWLIITRAAVFLMTALSACIGGLLAYQDGIFRWSMFLACLFGLVFAHATNNLVNDRTDYKKGIDKDNYYRSQYGPQPLEHGLLTPRRHMAYIVVTGILALLCGAYVTVFTGWQTLILIGAGAFFVLFYTWPLKYIGLGEPAVIVVWGPLMVGGTYFAVSGGNWSWEVALVSIVYALGPTTVLFGKHIDKIEEDRVKGVRTLPVIIGEPAARTTTIILWILQYVLTGFLIVSGRMGYVMAVVVLAVPALVRGIGVFREPRPLAEPEGLPENVWPLYLSANAFVYNRVFGGFLLMGLVVDTVLKAVGVY